jgi:hypothetical protein
MFQSTDDLTRSELRAIRGHYSCTTSPGARRWSAWRRGPPSRGQPGLPAVAVGIEAWAARSSATTRRSHACDSVKQPD